MRYPDLETKYELHETLGSGMMGTYMTVSPYGIMLWEKHPETWSNLLSKKKKRFMERVPVVFPI